MVMTTWDGHLRIDRLADNNTVLLTLLTVEPTTPLRLHPGLTAEFVTDDPHGPPAFLSVALDDGRLPSDVEELVGGRVAQAVSGNARWLRLNLVQVDELAAAWAPYRQVALTPAGQDPPVEGVLGAWAEELWSCLSVSLRRPEFRSAGDGQLAGAWLLPPELAEAVGVLREVRWRVLPVRPGIVDLELRVEQSGRSATAVLQAGLDDGSQQWASFEVTVLRLRMPASGELLSVRFRSEGRSS